MRARYSDGLAVLAKLGSLCRKPGLTPVPGRRRRYPYAAIGIPSASRTSIWVRGGSWMGSWVEWRFRSLIQKSATMRTAVGWLWGEQDLAAIGVHDDDGIAAEQRTAGHEALVRVLSIDEVCAVGVASIEIVVVDHRKDLPRRGANRLGLWCCAHRDLQFSRIVGQSTKIFRGHPVTRGAPARRRLNRKGLTLGIGAGPRPRQRGGPSRSGSGVESVPITIVRP
jgi:hypothetical protein